VDIGNVRIKAQEEEDRERNGNAGSTLSI
jgi:hypothetical protein